MQGKHILKLHINFNLEKTFENNKCKQFKKWNGIIWSHEVP